MLYDHEYLGLAVGQGQRMFPNLRQEAFDHSRFRNTVGGVDWGWWPDPWAYNRVAYDGQTKTLYILDEAHAHRCPNRETAQKVLEKSGTELVMSDAAEPKSIAEYRGLGINCRAARKGNGSVRYGYKWLQSLNAIVVDPVKCPQTAKEFLSRRYDTKGEDHHIDAVRYASSMYWRIEN